VNSGYCHGNKRKYDQSAKNQQECPVRNYMTLFILHKITGIM
jgi:hypothetical protein